MYCGKCGSEVPQNAAYCVACGKPTGVVPPPRQEVSPPTQEAMDRPMAETPPMAAPQMPEMPPASPVMAQPAAPSPQGGFSAPAQPPHPTQEVQPPVPQEAVAPATAAAAFAPVPAATPPEQAAPPEPIAAPAPMQPAGQGAQTDPPSGLQPPQMPEPVVQGPVPSLYGLACPSCGSQQYTAIGVKGSTGKALATSFAFGAIGNMVAGSSAAKNMVTEPIQYRCDSCKTKFESGPLVAAPEELLPAPCMVHFVRESSFVGMAVPQIVYMNGIKMGAVKNGNTLSMQTPLRYNAVFVTDQHGMAFKGIRRFEAVPGGEVTIRFNRKFL